MIGKKYNDDELQYEYEMGIDKAKNGANTKNCSFSLFSSVEKKNAWEHGVRDGEK